VHHRKRWPIGLEVEGERTNAAGSSMPQTLS